MVMTMHRRTHTHRRTQNSVCRFVMSLCFVQSHSLFVCVCVWGGRGGELYAVPLSLETECDLYKCKMSISSTTPTCLAEKTRINDDKIYGGNEISISVRRSYISYEINCVCGCSMFQCRHSVFRSVYSNCVEPKYCIEATKNDVCTHTAHPQPHMIAVRGAFYHSTRNATTRK